MTEAAQPTTSAPTPLRVGDAGLFQDPGNTIAAVEAIIAEARGWGLLGIDLEWNKDGRITWVGLGHAKGGKGRAVAFWWPTLPEPARKLIADAFADPALPKLGQNGIQADRPVWEREVGPTGGQWEDTMLLHHAAFPGIAHDLQQIVAQFQVVPPWKAWRRDAMKAAEKERAERAKADKKAARVAAHEQRNAERKAEAERKKAEKAAGKQAKIEAKVAEKEAKKSVKQLAHEAKIAEQQAARELKKQQKMADHAARNAAAAAAGKKARKPSGRTVLEPTAGAVTPMVPERATPQPTAADDEFPFDTLPENGLVCPVCGEPQRMSPRGETCANGHGGVPGVLPMLTPEEMGGQDATPPAPVELCPHNKVREACDVCMGRGVWEGVEAPTPAAVAGAMTAEYDDGEAAPPAPPVAVEAPRTLLRAPARPPATQRRLTVVITGADGSEQTVEIPREGES